jgi:GT2 family glycosyltransferase
MLVSIVIPFYNEWQLTHQRMMELYTYIETPCEIILVNDASTEEGIDGGVAWWQKFSGIQHKVRYLKSEENHGFGWSMNAGAEKATGDIIILLSNDVLTFGDFVTEIVTLLEENPKYFIGGEVLIHDTGWNVINNTIIPYANGWLLACTKEAWEDIGGFDLNFGHFDAEDIDISATAVSKGYILKGLRSKFKHIGGATIYKLYPNRQEFTRKNIEYLKQKWAGRL